MEGGSGCSYYSILGVGLESSKEDIKRAYRKLAMQYHPDRWIRCPSLLKEAKRRFQEIQEAYSVLSDQRKRTMYDAGLYDPNDDEEDEGMYDFVEELVSLMGESRREKKDYSMEDLRGMFMEMAQGYESSFGYCGENFEEAHQSECAKKRAPFEPNVGIDTF